MSAVICQPRRIVHPEIPRYAQRNNIVGTVVVELSVGLAGEVEEAKIISSPHPSLSKAVEQAVLQWEFQPPSERYRETRSFSFRL
jgi:periplasmic protein TonB